MEVSTQPLLPLRSSGSPPAPRTWYLLQTLASEIETAGNFILQQRVGFLHGSRNQLWRAHVPCKVHISWINELQGLEVSKMKWPLGFQIKVFPFKPFGASLRAHRGYFFLQRKGLQSRCCTTPAPVARQRLGTSHLGGCSAPYEMQPSKDKANLTEDMHQQKTKTTSRFQWDESKKKPKRNANFQCRKSPCRPSVSQHISFFKWSLRFQRWLKAFCTQF